MSTLEQGMWGQCPWIRDLKWGGGGGGGGGVGGVGGGWGGGGGGSNVTHNYAPAVKTLSFNGQVSSVKNKQWLAEARKGSSGT